MFWNGTKITQNAGGDEGGWNLQINDLGGVVWEGYLAKPGGPEILYWDGSDIIQLTNNDYRDYKPQTNANGHVVWGGYELGSPDLFYWDTNTVTRLTSNSDIGDPHINDNNNIVFMDGYGPDYDIVYWENYGISLYNTIKDNTIINNAMGIYVDNGENNIIYHNNLIDNTVQARDDENNFWDDGYPSGGNYWSNYIGQDYYSGPNQDIPGSDGIGDTSYIIDFDSQDNYPLMAPSVWMTDLYISDEDISLSNSNPYKWEEVTIYAQVHSIGFVETACTVSFYLDSVAPDNLIYREYEVLVPSHGNTTVFHDWVADVSGNHTIIVDITNSNPPETDLTNNTASKDIYIIPPCGKLKVKACSDKQKYIIGVDDHAEIIVKVTCQGEIIEGAAVSAWVIDPNEANSSVAVTEVSPGIYTGSYFFTNASIPGTYRIKAVASKAGYLNGENDDSKDKFFLDSPAANIPEVVSVALSDQLLMQGADVIVMANVNNNAEVSSIFAEVRRHGSKPVFALPLFDDGSHSDAVPNDGIYTYSFPSDDMSGTFTVDIYLNGRNFENRNVLVVNPEDMIAMETITGLHSSTNVLYLVSTQTNTTLNVTTAVDIADVSFTIVEHRTASEGKNIEIIASANIQTVLEIVCIEISYIESDIPDGINETDMQLYCWNPYSEELVPCEPSGVNPNDDIVWGDVDHFSLFVMKKSILRYDIFLDVGWNLISVPLIQTDTSISTVLSSIEGKWDVAQYYDATCTNDPWKTYIAYRPASLNTLLNLNHKNAFWLHTTEQCRLTIYGQASTSTAISLYAGWNLVGYPSMNQKSISDALAGTGYDSIEGFSASDPYHTGVLPDSYLMRPGEGYWVHVLADSVWIVDW
jgi:parallel beta-helix repeat protein